MEKLSEEQRTSVSKMSDERLRGKLVKAGYKQEDVDELDCPDLLELYVQVLLTKNLEVGEYDGEAAEGGGVELPRREQIAATNPGDRALEFEERRLWSEEKKWKSRDCSVYWKRKNKDARTVGGEKVKDERTEVEGRAAIP